MYLLFGVFIVIIVSTALYVLDALNVFTAYTVLLVYCVYCTHWIYCVGYFVCVVFCELRGACRVPGTLHGVLHVDTGALSGGPPQMRRALKAESSFENEGSKLLYHSRQNRT